MSKAGPELRSYLFDKNVQATLDAATFADDYASTHRSHPNKFKSNNNNNSNKPNSSSPSNQPTNNPPTQNSKPNHSKAGNSSGDSQNKNSHHTNKNTRPNYTCAFCGQDRCYQRLSAKAKSVNHISANVLPCDPSIVPIVSGTQNVNGVPNSSKDNSPSVDVSRVTGGGVLSPGGGVVQVATSVVPDELFAPYLYKGLVKVGDNHFTVQILRDTGAKVSLWKRPPDFSAETTDYLLLRGVFTPNSNPVPVPLINCVVECDLFQGKARVGVLESLPEDGITFLLGNDLIQGQTPTAPIVSKVPVCVETTQVPDLDLFPVCAVTRSMRRLGEDSEDTTPVPPDPSSGQLHGPPEDTPSDHSSGEDLNLNDIFKGAIDDRPLPISVPLEKVDIARLGALQAGDPDVRKLKVTATEDLKVEKGECFYVKEGIL